VDFSFTEEQLMLQDVARRIAQEKIAPSAEHHDRSGEFPLENIRLLGENGLMGIEVPAEYGGAGMDPIAYVLAMVEVAAGDAAHSTIMSVNNSLFCNGILTHGNEAQKQKYVRAIAEGEAIGAFALTEPQSGSDATAMRCRAVKQADGRYVINGKKSWITSGPVARYIVLFAMSEPDKGARGITAFLVDTEKSGFGRGKTEPKLGIRASATCEIEFTDYVAEAEDVLGQEGEGFKIAMGVLDAGRIGIASQAIGIARAAYEATLDIGAQPGDFLVAFGQRRLDVAVGSTADAVGGFQRGLLLAQLQQFLLQAGGTLFGAVELLAIAAAARAQPGAQQAGQQHGGNPHSCQHQQAAAVTRSGRLARQADLYSRRSAVVHGGSPWHRRRCRYGRAASVAV